MTYVSAAELEYELVEEPACSFVKIHENGGHEWDMIDKDWDYRYFFCGCGAYWREPRGALAREGKISAYHLLTNAQWQELIGGGQ